MLRDYVPLPCCSAAKKGGAEGAVDTDCSNAASVRNKKENMGCQIHK